MTRIRATALVLCFTMEQQTEDQWARSTVERAYSNITAERQRQGVSANELAQLCSQLGYPIARAVISKMDNHKRANITIPELLVVARALQVAPSNLLYSPLSSEQVEYLPGEHMPPMEAAGRLTHPEPPPIMNPTLTAQVGHLLRQLATFEGQREAARQGVYMAITEMPDDPGLREAYETRVHSSDQQIRIIRAKLEELDIELPEE